jgi:hypothetical protein
MMRLVVVAALLGGCGPIEYISTVTLQAHDAVARARRYHAHELAPYEYTLAVEELHKAKELAGHARWQQAIKFGRSSLENARKAEQMSEEKGAKPSENVD